MVFHNFSAYHNKALNLGQLLQLNYFLDVFSTVSCLHATLTKTLNLA